VTHSIPAPSLPARVTLREGSPAILAHLRSGCSSCTEALQLFADPAVPGEGRYDALVRFERELSATLAASASPAHALHESLQTIARRRDWV
jgi:hypothetical protein